MPTPIVPRVIFQQPYPPGPWETRPTLIGNEVEPVVKLDLRELTAEGHLGAFAELPADLAQEAQRYTSVPFKVQLLEEDRAILLALVARAFQRAGEQQVLKVSTTSAFRIDPPTP